MDIYFDAPNLLSFIRSAKKDRYEDCNRMLKDNFILHFSFSKTDVPNFCEDDKDDFNSWMRSMDSLKEDIRWGDKTFNVSFDPKQFEKDKGKLMSVYCLTKSQNYVNKETLLIASLGDEVDTLASLFIEGNQYTKNIFPKVKCWDDLSRYISPASDIIVVDPYIFSAPELNKPNIYTILKVLCQKSGNKRVNVVIFTLNSVWIPEKKISIVPKWDVFYTDIRNFVKCKCKPNVTFVAVDKKVLDEHDRSIFTNYKFYSSGDTYNYFDTQGNRVTDGRWLHAHSCAEIDNAIDALAFISDLQEIVKHINVKLRNPHLILKDKVSNFIDFNITSDTSMS